MAWWVWVLIWALLVAGAAVVLVPLVLSALRRMREVNREIAIATQRFALISEQLEQLQAATAEAARSPGPAVFDDLSHVRRARAKAVRQAQAMTAMRIQARQDRRPALPGERTG